MARAAWRRPGLPWVGLGAAAVLLSCGGDISIGVGDPVTFGGTPSVAGTGAGYSLGGSMLSLGGRPASGGSTATGGTAFAGATSGGSRFGSTTVGGTASGGVTTTDVVGGGVAGVGGVPWCDTSDPKRGIDNCNDCCEGEVCFSDIGCRPFTCSITTETCSLTLCSQRSDCGIAAGPVTPFAFAEDALGLCQSGNELFVPLNDGSIARLSWPDLRPTGMIPGVRALPGDCTVLGGFLYYPDVSSGSILRVDLSTSSTSVAFQSPASRPRAVAADGNSLWISADAFPRMLFNVSTESTPGVIRLLRQIPLTAMSTACDGLQITETGIWCSDLAATALVKISARDGSLLEGPIFLPPWYGLELIDGNLWGASNGYVYTPDGAGLTGPKDRVRGVATFGLHGVTL